ncbi:MAG: hypothetical protein KA163_14575 [Bacteroidia bacterium]|nr:hypothetical protein [Bacteroidia bacterium]
MTSFKNNRLNYLILFVISLLTLSSQDHNFYPGLDGSYFWAYNYLINFNPAELDKITFIYGPLAFLHYPVCYGILIILGCSFQILLKFCLGFCLLKLSQLLEIDKRIAFVLFALSCFTMFSPEAYLNLIVILFLVIYFLENKLSYLILVALLTAFGYYYKCSIGLSSVLFQAAFLINISVLNKKIDYKLFFKILLLNFSTWLALGLILFRGISPVFESLVTYYQNIIAFNETSAFYTQPENFILLITCGLSIILIFFVNKNQTFKLFWLLSILFLYTGYTHSMVRMDYSHYIGFLLYLILIIISSALFYKSVSKYTLPLLLTAFFCYYGNIGTKKDYLDFILSVPNGPKNFSNYVINHNKYRAKCLAQSNANVKLYSSLDFKTIREISKGTVDFFPWDLSFVEANKLKNWKPRPYLQNLNMSAYFDKKTADYFASGEAPDYLVWHGGMPGDFFIGIDNSNILTNEYHTIISIMEHYEVLRDNGYTLILKKRAHPLNIWAEDLGNEREVNCNEWIPLPQINSVLGCKIKYEFNMLRGLKKLLYRDDEFFIEYRTENNVKYRKRIWPGDAKDFIWLDPFITSVSDSLAYKNIKEIRFTNTNKIIHSGKLKLQFQTLNFSGAKDKKAVYRWFNP